MMTKKKKQTYTVHYSITGIYDIDIEAESPEEALDLAEVDNDWYKYAQFDMDAIEVTDENGDTVWEK